jgi:hypothetical protein
MRLGGMPEGLVADARTGLAAVGLRNPDALALVDIARGRVVRRVPLPESPRHLALAAPGGPVLAPAERAGRLVAVELPRGGVAWRARIGAFPHDAVAAAGRVFVSDERGEAVAVVAAGNGGQLARLSAPGQPGGVAATRRAVVAVAIRDRTLRAWDARTLRPLGSDPGGVGPTHAVSGPDGRIYVVDTQGDAVLVYGISPRLRFLDRTNLPGVPYGIAVDPRRGRLWVTLTARNELVELALTSRAPRPVRSYPTVRQPNSVAVNAGTGAVVVASRTDGNLQLLDRGP